MDFLAGLAVAIPIAYVAARVGRITPSGATVGVAVAAVAYAAFGLAGFAVLGMALGSTILASRIRGRSRSLTPLEIRGAGNVFANCAVGTAATLLEVARRGELGVGFALLDGLHPEVLSLWFVTAIAAGASDTVASEIGQSFGGAPRAILSRQIVAPGTPGAVTRIGLVAGAAAAAVIAAPAAALWLILWRDVAIVVLGCAAGALLESVLAASYEARGVIGNNALNLLNTAAASMVALALKGLLF